MPAGVVPIAFDRCRANGKPFGDLDPTTITMKREDGTLKATPGVLTGSGTAFTVTWENS
ncbi:hypothetical protein [Kitasatospora sp. NPDC097691]|uniref:hypothetical protein n=1 Tax=Kitasatospora sp. NPDC097691 TaxID=3157231 RepID=UPI0033322009